MSTRGAIGFQFNDKIYTTYNHSDSYPSWLGKEFLHDSKEIINKNLTQKDIVTFFKNLIFIKDEQKLTRTLFNKLVSKTLPNITEEKIGEKIDFYSEYREYQGNILYHFNHRFLIGFKDYSFLEDSLFCEWGYVINFDTFTVDIYRGFNKSAPKNGYYSDKMSDYKSENGYYPSDLLCRFSFEYIKTIEEDKFLSLIEENDDNNTFSFYNSENNLLSNNYFIENS